MKALFFAGLILGGLASGVRAEILVSPTITDPQQTSPGPVIPPATCVSVLENHDCLPVRQTGQQQNVTPQLSLDPLKNDAIDINCPRDRICAVVDIVPTFPINSK
jgi:hypothetical protein